MPDRPTAHDEDIGMLKAIAREHGKQITKLFAYHDEDMERQRDTDEKLNRAATILEGVTKQAHEPGSCSSVLKCLAALLKAQGGAAVVQWLIGGGAAALGFALAKLIDAYEK